MESYIFKSQNSDKEYISNKGKKWNNQEEKILLEELNKNMDIKLIAEIHKRTIGGIKSRLREIAYNLYIKNISIEEIISKTKLDKNEILKTIKRRQNKTKTLFKIESEIYEIKNDIKELKITINELLEMMKALYEFENV